MDNQDVADAEIVTTTPESFEDLDSDNPAAQPNAAESALNLETMIIRFNDDVEKLREQYKTQKDMLDDAFRNNPTYMEQDMKVKEATRLRTGTKQKIMKDPAVAAVNARMMEIKDEIKETQEGLVTYLKQYQQLTGNNQIVRDDGNVHEIIVITKLVRKKRG